MSFVGLSASQVRIKVCLEGVANASVFPNVDCAQVPYRLRVRAIFGKSSTDSLVACIASPSAIHSTKSETAVRLSQAIDIPTETSPFLPSSSTTYAEAEDGLSLRSD